MQRRDFITFVGGAAASWPLAARTQTLQRRRIGFLALGSGPSPSTDAFQDGLRTLGYVDGQTILIDFRYCSGDVDQLRIQAAGLIKSGVELIVAPDTVSAIVAGQATSTIPIVFAVAADPLATGLVSNVARPSGNLTGLTSGNSETVGKRLELLKEAFPEIVRLACIFNASDPSNVAALPILKNSASRLGLRIENFPIQTAGDIDPVFSSISRANNDALHVVAGLVTTANVRQIVQRANATGLPSIYSLLFFAQQGGVMAYSANSADLYRRAAGYVAKLLKGSKPVDLPVEFPTKFELIINLKTAKEMGLTISPTLLARADEVIE